MIRADRGLRFWLDYVEWSDGLWEGAGDVALVVLPPRLAAEFALPDEVQVTGDPDVAREDGATFLAAGHPAVIRAAETVLESGDVGVVTLAGPRSQPPSAAALQEKARERFPVDHGRVDAVGEPQPAVRGVLRAGAVVNYAVSTEDRFQERVECWVDLPTGLALPDRVSARLASGAVATGVAQCGVAQCGVAQCGVAQCGVAQCGSLAEIGAGVARAYQTLEAAALRRRQVLAAQARRAHDTERMRAEEYYDASLASLEHRRTSAPPDRQALLAARADSTREERARRLAEIAEKFQARHEIRPYRLHLVQVPVLRQAVDVRRGARRYPMVLDWLLAAGEFADIRCPNCGGQAGLVAAKTVLGCALCLPTTPGGPSSTTQMSFASSPSTTRLR
jgi:hypothetical protein